MLSQIAEAGQGMSATGGGKDISAIFQDMAAFF